MAFLKVAYEILHVNSNLGLRFNYKIQELLPYIVSDLLGLLKK